MLGVDLGTTATKGVLTDSDGQLVAESSVPMEMHSDHPGWAEADPGDWWTNLCILVSKLLDKTHASAGDIAVVATSGMVPAVLLVDSQGQPLGRATLQNDARATAEIDWLADQLSDTDLVERTGSPLSQQSVAPTLLWMQRHASDRWARARWVVGSYDWLAIALGAAPHVDRNWALESGLYELSGLTDADNLTGEVVAQVLNSANIPTERLAPVRAAGQVIGEVSAAAAQMTGLAPGTAIAIGGADHVLSAFAAGLCAPGDWLVKLGGAGDILVVTDHVFVDQRLYLDAHPENGYWLPNGCMATSGSLLRWLQRVLGEPDGAALEQEAEGRAPGQIICLPYFLGEKSPINDPMLRGAFVGLHLGHTRGDLYRSALEAVAFGFRHHVEVFVERGVVLGRARVSNGGSRSRVWKQILADVLGVSLEPVLDHPGASLGAALAGGVATGLIPDWRACEAMVRYDVPIEPDAKLRDIYDEAYGCYREAGQVLAPVSRRLATHYEMAP
jgi:xylulokinase